MRVVAILSPVASWTDVLEAAVAADDLGFDGVGLWDHYHSERPEWAYIASWSAHAALAQATKRVRIVPAVLNTLHYELGVLAKESSALSLISGGRFELAVGAGDWPASFAAWGHPFPPRDERVARLDETVRLLRRLWTGGPITFEGDFHTLRDAICVPPPEVAPRVVVGVGASLTLARSALGYADELNVYADEKVVAGVLDLVAGTSIEVSVFVSWEWDKWPADPLGELTRWRERGLERVLVSLGGSDMLLRLERLSHIE